ncbi:P-loop ATPase, Sll1717 family [Pseudomonas sp. VI4.1]|uniref:P-loop ATPase, Sll1717 family n=1 Tax=Pseudomonas sp. VI4.1 TaxID=1941346 RepID=UPI0009CF8412|nr:DNA repair protein [Pseudomonas sp. VI4.1]OPK11434.1 DNA repair protein [Pseudomonas sp. VI4.1]
MEEKKLKITRNLKIGALDAEGDSELLNRCFVDNGYLDRLMDVESPASIILGRTGSGKSALLYKIKSSAQKVVKLDPNDISVRFLEYSDIIQFFDALNINLDLFYKLLWRHVLTVEFLKLRYDIKSEYESKSFLDGIFSKFSRDVTKRKALEYFNEWGDRFWLDTDEQLKIITKKLETDTKSSIGAKYSEVSLSLDGAKKLSDEERCEIKQRASLVVNGLQIRKLNEVLDLLAEHSFDDPQKKFYILIDQLDEEWAGTETRVRFIRALIEEIKTFRRIKQTKIIAALRKDLLVLVFDMTRDSGFQEEKYESYILELRWSPEELERVIELRINEVFKSQYTKQKIILDDIFPKARKGGGQTSIEFIIERTLRRPRDILQFVNECFAIASDRERVSWRSLFAAEAQYSEKRLKSLKEEWGEVYPSFDDTIEILRGLKATFTRSLIKDSRLEEAMLALYEQKNSDPCVIAVKKYYDTQGVKEADVLSSMLSCLYRIGAIGVKTGAMDTYIWSYVDQASVTRGEIKRVEHMKIHKMLHRSLDIIIEQREIFEAVDLD